MIVKAVAVTPLNSTHEMVRKSVDDETDTESPSGGDKISIQIVAKFI